MLDIILNQIFTNQWRVIIFCAALLLAAAELGFRFGLRLHRTKDEARKGQIGGLQGAMLGLLGRLLGFTFATSVGRYESRRAMVLSEANAIGTTYLRASLLPKLHWAGVESLLRHYVDVRIEFYDVGRDQAKQAAAEEAATRLQRELWAHAVAAGKETPSPLITSFISSLNETIDLDAARLNALRTHVPGAAWLLVLAVAVSGCCVSGYSGGASGARSAFTNAMLPLLVAVAITLIADMDRPRRGLIGISQQPLVDLKRSLEVSQP